MIYLKEPDFQLAPITSYSLASTELKRFVDCSLRIDNAELRYQYCLTFYFELYTLYIDHGNDFITYFYEQFLELELLQRSDLIYDEENDDVDDYEDDD